MRTILKLQHHHHSLRLLPHQHTSYRALALLLFLTGGLLAGLQITLLDQTRAADYVVSATVPMYAPSTPPSIYAVPASTTNSSVALSGTCPVTIPAISVVVYRGSSIIGSTPCDFDGTFSLTVPLLEGVNSLFARAMTVTNHVTPPSNNVVISYNAPTPTQPTTPPSAPKPSEIPPLNSEEAVDAPKAETPRKPSESSPPVIIVENPIVIFGPNKEAVWRGTLEGGSPPYTLTIDWGDGTKTVIKDISPGEHEARHIYTKLRSYKIQLVAVDENGTTVLGIFAAVTPYVSNENGGGATIKTDVTIPLIGLYIAYISTLGIFGYFWLKYRHRFVMATVKPSKIPASKRQKTTKRASSKRR